jgi:hypothetical protein
MSPRKMFEVATLTKVALRVVAAVALALTVGCRGGKPPLLALNEARLLAEEARVQLAKAAGASDRAVMAESDDASASFAREARAAADLVARDAARLGVLMHDLDRAPEADLVEKLQRQLAAYRKVDESVLAMAVENTNLKAQRLAFGPLHEAADTFAAAVRAAALPAKDRGHAEVDALEAALAVRNAQVLAAPHIAEAQDAVMERLERDIAAREAGARKALAGLGEAIGPAGQARLVPAQAALDRFTALAREIVALSRRNSNVRSLAVAVRQKPALTSACDGTLAALGDALAKATLGGSK